MTSSVWKIFFGLFAAAAILTAGAAAQATELLGVRFGPDKDKTRVVFDLKGNAAWSVSGDEAGNGRLFIDFEDLSLTPADREFHNGKGHIARYGFTSGPEGGVRAVLDFKKTAKIKEVFMIVPSGAVTKYRLVVDLATADKPAFIASLPNRYPDLTAVIERATTDAPAVAIPSTPARKEVALPPAPEEKPLVVVIDPGHGGRDPGSQGQSGAYERTVTLEAAKKLAEILKKRGRYDVVLTRESDTDPRIKPDQRDELARREELARNADAKLFISLHADAISKPAVRGASVYTLSEQGSERSAKLAKSQGNYQAYAVNLEEYGQDVGGILLNTAQDKTNTASSRLAKMLIDHLSDKTPMLNRSHRTGNLRVLLAPDVPAVLLEMAFISNVKDEANLKSPVWRERVMTAVADSIDQYFDEQADQRYAANSASGSR